MLFYIGDSSNLKNIFFASRINVKYIYDTNVLFYNLTSNINEVNRKEFMNILSSLILDAPVIFSVIFFSVEGWKRGAVRPFINALGSILSAVISAFLSINISKSIYNSFLKEILFKQIHKFCLNAKIESIPKYFTLSFRMCKLSKSDLSKIMLSGNPEMTLLNIISPFMINVLRIFIGSLIFGVVIFFVRKISRSSNMIFKAPVLSQFNSALGALFGFLKGALISWVCALFLHISLIYWENPPKVFSESSICSTSVFVKFYNFNPITNKFMNDVSNMCELDFFKWISKK